MPASYVDHYLMAYAERFRRKRVPFSGFKHMKKSNSLTYQSLTPRAFHPPPGKALDEANYMYLSITNRRSVEIKTVFPSSKVTVKKVQYYLFS